MFSTICILPTDTKFPFIILYYKALHQYLQTKNADSFESAFLAGAVGFFLLARRSSVRAALTAHWAVIHSRPSSAMPNPQTPSSLRGGFKICPCQEHGDRSLSRPVGDTDRRSVGNRKERLRDYASSPGADRRLLRFRYSIKRVSAIIAETLFICTGISIVAYRLR